MIELIDLKKIEKNVNTKKPILLSSIGEHKIYWVGIDDETAFRCNVYLVQDKDEYIIIDPGSREFHHQVKDRVFKIVDPKKISALILCHQDPDVVASMVDWLEINSDLTIISSARVNILLPHYGRSDYKFFDITANPKWRFKSGNELEFTEAPFLHSPGAFTTLDLLSGYLFSAIYGRHLIVNGL